MTSEVIASLFGVIVSVVLEMLPWLKDKWTKWKWKPLTLFAGMVALSVGVWALACFAGITLFPKPTDCGINGALKAAGVGVLAFMANQTTFAVVTRHSANATDRNVCTDGEGI